MAPRVCVPAPQLHAALGRTSSWARSLQAPTLIGGESSGKLRWREGEPRGREPAITLGRHSARQASPLRRPQVWADPDPPCGSPSRGVRPGAVRTRTASRPVNRASQRLAGRLRPGSPRPATGHPHPAVCRPLSGGAFSRECPIVRNPLSAWWSGGDDEIRLAATGLPSAPCRPTHVQPPRGPLTAERHRSGGPVAPGTLGGCGVTVAVSWELLQLSLEPPGVGGAQAEQVRGCGRGRRRACRAPDPTPAASAGPLCPPSPVGDAEVQRGLVTSSVPGKQRTAEPGVQSVLGPTRLPGQHQPRSGARDVSTEQLVAAKASGKLRGIERPPGPGTTCRSVPTAPQTWPRAAPHSPGRPLHLTHSGGRTPMPRAPRIRPPRHRAVGTEKDPVTSCPAALGRHSRPS